MAAEGVAGIDQVRVGEWFVEHVAGVRLPLEFSLITGGRSNLTFRVRDAAGTVFVLRRPPLGHVLESAHDMAREHRIITALGSTDVPLPATLGLCEDVEVNGAPFYVMEFVTGQVLHDTRAAAALPEAQRWSLGEHIIDVLSSLHRIDPDDVGLGDLGRREAYLARQLKRWNRQWEATKTHEIPAMEESSRLLGEDMPEQVGAAIVHGDYRPGNMMVDGGRMRALLDWELCTLGDPLADLGYLLNSWIQPGEGAAPVAPTSVGGFPDRDVLCERYQAATGRDLESINYYRAFSHWRLAAIGQGVYKRYLMGAMGDTVDLDAYKLSVENRAKAALKLLTL